MISYHSPLALYARSHYLPLALLACLQLSSVLQSPLSLWKTCEGGSIRRTNPRETTPWTLWRGHQSITMAARKRKLE